MQQISQPIDIYLRALSKIRNAQALTPAEEYAYRNFTPADVVASKMLQHSAEALQATGLSEDMKDQEFAAAAGRLQCPDCGAEFAFVGDRIFCRCNDHEAHEEHTTGITAANRPLLGENEFTDPYEDRAEQEMIEFRKGLNSLHWFWFACKWLGVLAFGAVVGMVWFHGLGAWVCPRLFGR